MPGDKADVVMFGAKPIIEEALIKAGLHVHRAWAAPDQDAFIALIAPKVRAIAAVAGHGPVDGALMARFPKLEIVSSFGVGYDHIDAKWAGQHGVIVTNTPDVLNEEVADTALGLLLCTVRHLPQAERYLRAGNWPKHGEYELTPSLRDRTVGIVGMGRIGKAIARRLDAMKVPVVYHSRRPADAAYKHYPNLIEMARAADVLLVITPGGAATRNLINADVLDALGPEGILINMARGSVVDELALIEALKEKKILSAGLDVWEVSNPDRDPRCTLTFKLDAAPQGRVVTLGPSCAAAFPDLRPTVAWTMGSDDALKLVDAKGIVLFELTEVESGMYETTPSYTHYFLQTLAAINKDRITDDLFGDWQITRGPGRTICELTLGNTAYDPDSFVVTLKPGCDALITRFAPVAWRLDS